MLYRRVFGEPSRAILIARSLSGCYIKTPRHARHYSIPSERGVLRSKFPDLVFPSDQSYVEFMLNRCLVHGDKDAIVDDARDRSYTYNDIVSLSKKCGSALLRAGMKKGDVFAVFLPNVAEFPILLYGIQAAGGVVSTVNSRYTKDEVATQLRDCGAKFIVSLPSMYSIALDAAANTNVEHVFDSEVLLNDIISDDGSQLPSVYTCENPKDEVTILPYSSGTTGASKGVMQTHYNLIAHTMMLTHQDIMPRDRTHVVMTLLPMFHAFGLVFVLGTHLWLGSQLVVMDEFDGEKMLKLFEKYKVTDFPLVPPLALFLAKHPLVEKFDLSSLESALCAAAPIGKGVFDQIHQRLPNLHSLREGYGLTECTAGAIVNPHDPAKCKSGSVGVVLPNIEAKVVDVDTREPLGPDQDGEICLRGPSVTKGYLNKPEQTAKDFDSEGWLHTGDIGHYDEDEYFYIVDRLKELIKYKGKQVPPAEIEAVLVSHPHITDAAVIGVPDEEVGELPKAFVVAKAPITEQEVIEFVAQHVAPERKLRGGAEILEAIPKTASGKILRRVLKEKEMAKRSENN